MKWIASAAFGLEGQTMRDLKRLGAANAQTMNVGGATFEGDFSLAFAANLWLRTADRVLLVAAEFEARSFKELFNAVKAIEWERYIPVDGRFPVRARCVRSQLMSESDTQSIVKKAIVERLKEVYHVEWFAETAATVAIDVHIRNDHVTIGLDSSGAPLSKRGYRTWNGEAPIRETLAAGLVLRPRSSRWRARPACAANSIWKSGRLWTAPRWTPCAAKRNRAMIPAPPGKSASAAAISIPKRWNWPAATSARPGWRTALSWSSATCATSTPPANRA